MDFEFDPNKSRKNKKKHGIDFIKAQELWNDPDRIEIPTKFLDEPRYVLIGKIDDVFWSAIFTYRGDKIRLISVRRARKNEREIYES
ncbi:MAG: BrnT family toxin [Deltaproteobacteria bacterium]|nr:BrnT family toxin [Deltaproteobacteria bacterium]